MTGRSETTSTWTVMDVLDWSRHRFEALGLDSPRLDAELLLGRALGVKRIELYTRFDQPLSDLERERVRALVRRRMNREPVAYILGSKAFWTFEVVVDPRVLIPRPETEGIVERILAETDPEETGRFIDVGTGSGAIACALALERPRAKVSAIDISEAALQVAETNARKLGCAVDFARSDLLAAVEDPATVVAANLPYIPRADMASLQAEVQHEPALALDGGPDGLDLIRRLAEQAHERLADRGLIVLEVGHDQADRTAEILRQRDFDRVAVDNDLAGHPRVVWAQRPVRSGSTSR
ncbi:MAG: peptide chain release factor N(5)-glutamine methyltransferase [Myxococcota bacterium]